jgi:hypothetical protein
VRGDFDEDEVDDGEFDECCPDCGADFSEDHELDCGYSDDEDDEDDDI